MRIRSSPMGADFPRERFLRTPIRVILETIEFLDNEEKRHFNLISSTTAQLCVQLIWTAYGFAGGKGPKPQVKVQDFLPFPDWRPLEDSATAGPSPVTRALLTKLLKERRIPMPIYAELISPPEISLD